VRNVNCFPSTYPSNDDEPIIKVKTDAQDMSGEQAQSEEDSGKHNGNGSSNNQLMSTTAVMEWHVDRRSGT
jgi:hypothetical protein